MVALVVAGLILLLAVELASGAVILSAVSEWWRSRRETARTQPKSPH